MWKKCAAKTIGHRNNAIGVFSSRAQILGAWRRMGPASVGLRSDPEVMVQVLSSLGSEGFIKRFLFITCHLPLWQEFSTFEGKHHRYRGAGNVGGSCHPWGSWGWVWLQGGTQDSRWAWSLGHPAPFSVRPPGRRPNCSQRRGSRHVLDLCGKPEDLQTEVKDTWKQVHFTSSSVSWRGLKSYQHSLC